MILVVYRHPKKAFHLSLTISIWTVVQDRKSRIPEPIGMVIGI